RFYPHSLSPRTATLHLPGLRVGSAPQPLSHLLLNHSKSRFLFEATNTSLFFTQSVQCVVNQSFLSRHQLARASSASFDCHTASTPIANQRHERKQPKSNGSANGRGQLFVRRRR